MKKIAPVLTLALLSALLCPLINSCAFRDAGPVRHSADTIQTLIAQANENFYLDSRIWVQKLRAEQHGQTILLTGEAFFRQPVQSLINKIRKTGYADSIIDSVQYLPEAFEDDRGYGVIIQPYVMSRYQPVSRKHEGTEILYGEPVRLIRETGSYYQVQSATGYLGYIPSQAVRTMQLAEWNRYQSGPYAVITSNLTLKSGLQIPMGSRLPLIADNQLLLADGNLIPLPGEAAQVYDPADNPLRTAIIQTARSFLGLPYVWGGRSGNGVDCSGFVMQCYGMHGINLPRDTDEMANTGRLIGLNGWLDALLPGDLLFFAGSRRLVTHTAIYLGSGRVIHSLGSGVQIQSLNPGDPDYSAGLARRFIFAKRIFE